MRLMCLVLFLVLGLSGCAAVDAVKSMAAADRIDVYDAQQQAMAAYEDQDNARAEALFKSVLRVAPNDAPTWFYLGNLYARSGQPEQAVEAYEKTLMLDGSNARAWHNLGVVKLRQSRAAFIRSFELTDEANPLHAKAEAVILVMEKIPLSSMRKDGQRSEREP